MTSRHMTSISFWYKPSCEVLSFWESFYIEKRNEFVQVCVGEVNFGYVEYISYECDPDHLNTHQRKLARAHIIIVHLVVLSNNAQLRLTLTQRSVGEVICDSDIRLIPLMKIIYSYGGMRANMATTLSTMVLKMLEGSKQF